MRAPWHPIRIIPLLLACPVAILLAGFLLFLRLTTRVTKPRGPIPLGEELIYMSHTEGYFVNINPQFLGSGSCRMVFLSNHGFLAYTWFLWQGANRFPLFRFDSRKASRPTEQIIEFLEKHSKTPFGILSDSGGPYGKMRVSLVRIARLSKRPVVALRLNASRYLTIYQHKIPLPFSTISTTFSEPVILNESDGLTENEELVKLQTIWENLAASSSSPLQGI